jgi:thiol-disulfide isomerase/thioredoxin
MGRHGAALVLLALVAATAASAGDPIALDLVDPASGARVAVTPGAPLLHLVLFATWCPPCVDELEALAALEARWGHRGYSLVLVAVQKRHTADRLVRFSAEQSPPGRLLLDADGKAPQLLAAEGLPTHVLFDAEGNVVLRAAALEDGIAETVDRLMRERGAVR